MAFTTNGGFERMRISSSGDIGIGITSPAAKLDIQGSNVRIRGNNSYSATTNLHFSQQRAKIVGQLEASGATPGASLQFYTMPNNGSITERMRISSSGNVGIGTTSPNMGLELFQNSLRLSRTSAVTAHSDISLTHASSADYGSLYFDNSASTGAFVFRTGGTNEKVRILGAGGITFNGDSAQANALDDYEEGSWTPAIAQTSNSSTFPIPSNITLTNNSNKYVKIGTTVWCSFGLDFSSQSIALNEWWRFTGLPFGMATDQKSFQGIGSAQSVNDALAGINSNYQFGFYWTFFQRVSSGLTVSTIRGTFAYKSV
tara:strand:- start:122 stop:1066 length:945 start_codon:yes stop_codon:yes gene_type:complete